VREAAFWTLSPYSVVRAVGVVVPELRELDLPDTTICSRLVIETYRKADIDLCPTLSLESISPNSIYESPLLEDVTRRCSRKLTEPQFYLLYDASVVASAGALLGHVHDWFFAVLWAINPVRHAWSSPVSAWRTPDYVFAYLTTLLYGVYVRIRVHGMIMLSWMARLRLFRPLPAAVFNSRETMVNCIRLLEGRIAQAERGLNETDRDLGSIDLMSSGWRRMFIALKESEEAIAVVEAKNFVRTLAWEVALLREELGRREQRVRNKDRRRRE
jgi:hypothetical protein